MIIVYCIAGTYRPAGMERVLTDKANWLAGHGHEVTVVTTDQHGRADAFPFDDRVRRIDLGIHYEEDNGKSLANKLLKYPGKQLRHRRRLARLLKTLRPDVTVSMFCNEVGFLPRIHDGSAKVLEVHFSRFKRLQYGRKGLWGLADRLMSRKDLRDVQKYDRFVVLTQEDMGYWGGLPNMTVIPNALAHRPETPSDLQAKVISAIGRYAPQKGLDRLIDAWRLVAGMHPDWQLRLVGDGELREELQEQIDRLNLGENVLLGKATDDMDTVYRNTSILALSSHYEGLPMVLLEAQAYGVPAVAFTCQCGPRDVITDGVDGILVPEGDVNALAQALDGLIREPERLREMGRNAFRAADRWDRETIMEQWTELFENASSSRR